MLVKALQVIKSHLRYSTFTSSLFMCASLLSACSSPPPAPYPITIDWSAVTDLNATDQDSISQIASSLLLLRQVEIAEGPRNLTGGRVLVVSSWRAHGGVYTAWDEFRICHISGARCMRSSRWGIGDWRVLGEVSLQERWRIFDGDWSVDVELGGAVSYAEAETIIQAVHRNQLSKVQHLNYFTKAPSLDGRRISIRSIDPLAREFMLTIGAGSTSGESLYLRIKETTIEIFEYVTITASI